MNYRGGRRRVQKAALFGTRSTVPGDNAIIAASGWVGAWGMWVEDTARGAEACLLFRGAIKGEGEREG